MLETMKINKKSFMAIAFSASTALALTACGTDADPQPATETADATDTAAESAAESASSTAQQSAESEAADDTTAEPTEAAAAADGEDPVFAALGAVLGEYPDGVVISIDREDDTETYEIDIVDGADVVELKVDAANSSVVEGERDQNEDEVNKVAAVKVSAEDAIRQALDQHPGAIVDEAELEEEGAAIEWQIDLDDTERNDVGEVRIVAN